MMKSDFALIHKSITYEGLHVYVFLGEINIQYKIRKEQVCLKIDSLFSVFFQDKRSNN